MNKIKAPTLAGALLVALVAGGPVQAQGRIPAPPVPGPYPLMPIMLMAPAGGVPSATAMPNPIQPGVVPGQGAMRMPYWMQGQPDTGAPVGTDAAGSTYPPVMAAPAPMPAPNYGQSTAPGFFPGYQAGPGQPMSAQAVTASDNGMPPQMGQPYVPQAYPGQPGWGARASGTAAGQGGSR